MSTTLILMAIIPPIFLMSYVYKKDHTTKEPIGLLLILVFCGYLATKLALVIERLGQYVLNLTMYNSDTYLFIYYMVIVGLAEEGAKYIFLKIGSFKSKAFDSTFDGVIYAVFVSLGFALFENISYVLIYGFDVALTRAFTAIPGHCCFGVVMGVFYGLSKRYYNYGNVKEYKKYQILSVVIPAFIHGCYDYVLVTSTTYFDEIIFILGLVLLYIICFVIVNKSSKNDTSIS